MYNSLPPTHSHRIEVLFQYYYSFGPMFSKWLLSYRFPNRDLHTSLFFPTRATLYKRCHLKCYPPHPPTPTEDDTVFSHRCNICAQGSCCNVTASSAARTSLVHPSLCSALTVYIKVLCFKKCSSSGRYVHIIS